MVESEVTLPGRLPCMNDKISAFPRSEFLPCVLINFERIC